MKKLLIIILFIFFETCVEKKDYPPLPRPRPDISAQETNEEFIEEEEGEDFYEDEEENNDLGDGEYLYDMFEDFKIEDAVEVDDPENREVPLIE